MDFCIEKMRLAVLDNSGFGVSMAECLRGFRESQEEGYGGLMNREEKVLERVLFPALFGY